MVFSDSFFMKRTRVKICGITSLEDALMAASFACDAIGLNFYKKSPRFISSENAKVICDAIAPFVTTTALFVDADESEVKKILDTVRIDLLQFHGNESEQFCASFSKPYIKVISIKSANGQDIANAESQQKLVLESISRFSSAQGFLIDHFDPVKIGGTGKTFDWRVIPESLKGKIILAGGLHAANVKQAIAEVAPYAVDVSSGVEKFANGVQGETLKGKKDKQRMAEFFSAVKEADSLK